MISKLRIICKQIVLLLFVCMCVSFDHSYTLMQNPPGLSGNDYCKSPDGGSEYNSHIADFTTAFHRRYREAIVSFLGKTKMDMLETDGPYEAREPF
eukprot:COSAG05_NODE_1668_length_4309_cov_3.260570_3_plen_96_part_00